MHPFQQFFKNISSSWFFKRLPVNKFVNILLLYGFKNNPQVDELIWATVWESFSAFCNRIVWYLLSNLCETYFSLRFLILCICSSIWKNLIYFPLTVIKPQIQYNANDDIFRQFTPLTRSIFIQFSFPFRRKSLFCYTKSLSHT